jgi:hypothetical protein
MATNSRRTFLQTGAGLVASGVLGVAGTRTALAQEITMEEWMEAWIKDTKLPVGALHVSRFVEPMYFLTKTIGWKPNAGQDGVPVQVPIGFVSDLASIPRVFWSLLRPDGEYSYPAIIHDYLYWMQDRSRDACDLILKFGMEDFKISPVTVTTIYQAVRVGGGSAWSENAKLKAAGEKRILKIFPDNPLIRWKDWKKRPEVFA